MNLFVVKRNVRGNPQLSEIIPSETVSHNGIYNEIIDFFSLKPNEYWSIKEPSARIIALLDENFPGWQIYNSIGGRFAISPEAATFYNPNNKGYGAGVIIEFVDDCGKRWYLEVSDDKPYISHPQGAAEIDETFIECAKREVLEETGIDLTDINLIEIAEYSLVYRSNLVDCQWDVVTKVFYTKLSYTDIAHIFHSINFGDYRDFHYIIVDRPGPEINHIIAMSVDKIADVPEYFPQIRAKKMVNNQLTDVAVGFEKFSHHRQFLELLSDPHSDTHNKSIVKPPFLKSITYYGLRGDNII